MDLKHEEHNASDVQQRLTDLIRKKMEEMEVLQKLSDTIPGSYRNSTLTEAQPQEDEN
jgi:hypothetical protein